MKKFIFSLLCVSFMMTFACAKPVDYSDLNKLEGKEKWIGLRMYLEKVKALSEPPTALYYLEKNGTMHTKEFIAARETRVNGKWSVNENEGFICFDLPGIEPGLPKRFSPDMKYRSFLVEYENCKKGLCKIILHTGKKFVSQNDYMTYLGSKDYLVLSPVDLSELRGK